MKVNDVVTIIVSLAGGSVGGTGVAAFQAARLRDTARRGRARLLHEDFYRLQSTITRLYYETQAEGDWGSASWLLVALTNKADQQDIVAHIPAGGDFTACAGALGWAEYLREGYGHGAAPNDDRLIDMYTKLDRGRQVVLTLAKLAYAPHDAEGLVKPAARLRNRAVVLSAQPETPAATLSAIPKL